MPSAEHEQQRRRVENGVLEWWFYIQSELASISEKLSEDNQQFVTRLGALRNGSAEHYMYEPQHTRLG